MGLTPAEVIHYIQRCRPRIIGISIMSPTLRNAYLLIREIQAHCPEATLVVGGAHIDADPESVRDLGVPYGFHGECEYEFLEFCQRLLRGEPLEAIPGLISWQSERLVIGDRKVLDEIDSLPVPAYDLLPIDRYYSPSTNRRTISVITSRGCPYHCLFCSRLPQAEKAPVIDPYRSRRVPGSIRRRAASPLASEQPQWSTGR